MGVVWRNSDLNTLRTELRAQSRFAIDASEQVMEQTMDEAVELQRTLLDRATTRTGEERLGRGRGNTVGRNDTGQMIGSISSDVETTRNRVTGRWGWPFTAEDYYRFQDFGTGKIPAAHSLLDSFVAMREVWIRRMKRIAGR